MMHKCSLSHPKLEAKRKSWKIFFYYKFMQKPRKISFNFIKCRNFYVFLINAMLRMELRGRICYYFNEKIRSKNETSAKKVYFKVWGWKLWVIESLIKTNCGTKMERRGRVHNYSLSFYSLWAETFVTRW